jgi:predicted RNase H-like nuclease (RuvC/YqgF family)
MIKEMNIQEEAYSEAMDEIVRLKRLLELRDTEIGALRREIIRRNAEIDKLKTDICRLLDALVAIIDNDGHYPANAPLRKVIAEARCS